MEKISPTTRRKPKTVQLREENSAVELTFSYAFDCLSETDEQGFLGFTLSPEYVPVHLARSEELSNLRYYFPLEKLKAVVVWSVHTQREAVIKWTSREALDTYLKAHGVTETHD